MWLGIIEEAVFGCLNDESIKTRIETLGADKYKIDPLDV